MTPGKNPGGYFWENEATAVPLTAACTLLENNQIWICCWWLDVLAGCDFKVTFMVLPLLPCILRGNWITTFKVTRFLSSFLLHCPLFFPFDIEDKLLLIFLHTSRTRFRSYLITLYIKISTSYWQLIIYTRICIYSFLCSPLQACGGFSCCCSFIHSPSKNTGQNPSILSGRNKTNISHVMLQKPWQ